MDPANWSIKEFLEVFGGPGAALVLLFLNFRGYLWWKPQVDKLLTATVESAQKLDEVRLAQIDAERDDKNAWKGTCDQLRVVIETLKGALEEERKKTRGGT